ncbi:hypothetical protein ES703_94472 [subsurface metagenome]
MDTNTDGHSAFVSPTSVVVIMAFDGHEVSELDLLKVVFLNNFRASRLNIIIYIFYERAPYS